MSNADKPPGWPVGYPCIAKDTWTDNRPGCVSVEQGDECVVTHLHPDPTMSKQVCYIAVNRKQIQGWIHKSHITMPGPRKFGDIEHDYGTSDESSGEGNYWTRIDMQGVAIIRYPATYARDEDEQRVFFEHNSVVPGTERVFRLARSKTRLNIPKAGQECYIVAEIILNGKAHTIPWARLMTAGPMSDHLDALSIAFRVEHEDDSGQWWANYIQSEGRMTFVDTHVLTDYAKVIAMRRFLLQQTTQDAPNWLQIFGIAKVKTITYDHQNQKILIRDRAPDHNPIPSPTLRPRSTIMNELLSIGLPSASLTDPRSRPHPVSDKCDLCLSTNSNPCERITGTLTCKECNALNRNCSYAPRGTEYTKEVQAAIFMAGPSANSARKIRTPEIETIETLTAYDGSMMGVACRGWRHVS